MKHVLWNSAEVETELVRTVFVTASLLFFTNCQYNLLVLALSVDLKQIRRVANCRRTGKILIRK